MGKKTFKSKNSQCRQNNRWDQNPSTPSVETILLDVDEHYDADDKADFREEFAESHPLDTGVVSEIISEYLPKCTDPYAVTVQPERFYEPLNAVGSVVHQLSDLYFPEGADFMTTIEMLDESLDERSMSQQMQRLMGEGIPIYEKQSLREGVRVLPVGVLFSDLRIMGWPKMMAEMLVKIKARDELYSEHQVRQHRQQVGARNSYSPGEVVVDWQIEWSYFERRVPKPLVYELLPFRAWVYDQAQLRMKATGYSDLWYPTGNFATQALFYGRNFHPRMARELLEKATVYAEKFCTKKGAYKDHYLAIRGEKVSMPKRLRELQHLFPSKELYAQCMKYLSFGSDYNPQESIHAMVTHEPILPIVFRGECFRGLSDVWSSVYLTRAHRHARDLLEKYFLSQGRLSPEWVKRVLTKDRLVDSDHFVPQGLWDGKFKITHEHKIDFQIQANVLFQAFAADDRTRSFVSFAALLTSLCSSAGWMNAVSILTLFCTSNVKLWKIVSSKVSALGNVMFPQGALDWFASLPTQIYNALCEILVTSGVVSILTEFIPSTVAMFGPLVADWVVKFKTQLQKETIARFAASLLNMVGDFLDRVRECVTTGSLAPLWGKRWSSKAWVHESFVFTNYFNMLTGVGEASVSTDDYLAKLRKTGALSERWTSVVSVAVFIERLTEHIQDGERLLDYYGSYPGIKATVTKRNEELVKFRSSLDLQSGDDVNRVQPYMLVWFGPPGVGKTALSQIVFRALAARKGYDSSATAYYEWAPGQNFQDGFTGTQWYINMDDVDQGVAPPTASVKNHVQSVIDLVNNKPCPIEQADVVMKGKVSAHPLFVNYCTNFADCRVAQNSLEPRAFYRRIKCYVRVEVKPQFRITDGVGLDPVKAEESGTHDMFDLFVSHYEEFPGEKARFLSSEVRMSFPEFMRHVLTDYSVHMASQRRRLVGSNSEKTFCDQCGLPNTKSCCVKRQADGSRGLFEEFTPAQRPFVEVVPQGTNTTVESDGEHPIVLWLTGIILYVASVNITISWFHYLLRQYDLWVAEREHQRRLRQEVDEFLQDELRMFQQIPQGIEDPRDHYVDANRGILWRLWYALAAPLVFLVHPLTDFKHRQFVERRGEAQEALYEEGEHETSFKKGIRGFISGVRTATGIPRYFFMLYFRPEVVGDRGPKDFAWHTDPVMKDEMDIKTMLFEASQFVALLLALRMALRAISPKIEEGLQGREGNAVTNAVNPLWNRCDQKAEPGIPGFGRTTFTKDDIIKVLRESHFDVKGENGQQMHAFAVSHDLLLVPTHVMSEGGKLGGVPVKGFSYTVQGTEKFFTFDPQRIEVLASNKELCIVKVPSMRGTFGLGKKMMLVLDNQIQQFDEIELWSDKLERTSSYNQLKKTGSYVILTSDSRTVAGDCGMIYIARSGTSWRVVAMHYALHTTLSMLSNSQMAVGAIVTAQECERVGLRFGQPLEDVVVVAQSFSKAPEGIEMGYFSAKSEVWAAQSHHGLKAYTFGLMHPPLTGSSMVTKVRRSMICDEFLEMERQHCGVENYWGLPNFKGSMKDDKWVSPYTNMFVTQNLKQLDEDLTNIALMDLLAGIGDLDCLGYSEISEEDAIKGVPGSYQHAFNLKTSIGPPFNQSKWHYIHVDPKEGSYCAPEISRMTEEVLQILAEGNIPSPLGLCTLKDEALKPDKMPRVFICLPFSYNLVLKMKGAGWMSFVRANYKFFESFVGINMTSSECNTVIDMLKEICPDLSRVHDGDVKALDKSYSGCIFTALSMIVFVICSAIGTAPHDNRRLVLGLKHITLCIKNDLLRYFNNPSGCFGTVEFNGLVMSFLERYVYYSQRGFSGDINLVRKWAAGVMENPIPEKIAGLNFRANVALAVYGDDNIKCFREPPPEGYLDVWKDKVGMTMTPADKTDRGFSSHRIEDTSFLKRKFVFDEDLGMYVAQLSMLSIVRMLVIKKDSILSDVDHSAVSLTEAMREMVYYGEKEYTEFYGKVVSVVEKYHLQNNPYLVLKPYSHWRGMMKDGNFQTWSLREPQEPVPLEPGNLIPQMLSTSDSIQSVVQSDSASQTQIIQHSAGTILGDSTVVTPHQVTNITSLETLPLVDFLMRPVQIARVIPATTDVAGTLIAIQRPWQNWLADARVAEKLKNFAGIRGTLNVVVVVTTTPTCYGTYVVTAFPQLRTVTGPSSTMLSANCCQGDLYSMIEMSASDGAAFKLPFVCDTDYMATSSTFGETPAFMWDFIFTCLHPLSQSMVTSNPTAVFTVYAYADTDLELVIATPQGKKFHEDGHLKTLNPKLHEKSLKASQVAGFVGDVSGVLSMVPEIGPIATQVAGIAKGAQSILEYFGFTRESKTSATITTKMQATSNVALANADDYSLLAALMEGNSITIDPTICGGDGGGDEASFASLCRRPVILARTSWTSALAPGATLFDIPVTPFYGAFTASQIELTFPTAGYVGLPFNYWRGTMVYTVHVSTSVMHRGRLVVAWLPDGATVTSLVQQANSCIMDLSNDREITFEVGYNRTVPYLLCTVLSSAVPIIPYGSSTNGRFIVQVFDAIVAPSNIAGTTVTLFAAAKDMDFNVMRNQLAYIDGLTVPTSVPFEAGLIPQGKGALGDQLSSEAMTNHVLVKGGGPYPGKEVCFGEKVLSVRALMQKPWLTGIVTTSSSVNYQAVPRNILTNAGGTFSLASFYALMFLGVATSERYKVMSAAAFYCGMGREVVPSNHVALSWLDQIAPTEPVYQTSVSDSFEFLLPFYLPLRFRLSREVRPTDNGALNRIDILGLTGAPFGNYRVYHSFGPDIRLGPFRQTPSVLLAHVGAGPRFIF